MGRPKKGGGAKVTEKSSVSPDLEMAAVLDTPQVRHNTGISLNAGLWIRLDFNPDPDYAF
jgi:hypothetical protein